MKIIGITGSSGSGKTTLSNILKSKYNFEIIDADKVARELTIPGTKYLQEIKDKFGEEIFFEDGTLNRKALAKRIYTNTEDLKILNDLTFKYVVEEIKKYISEFRKKERNLNIENGKSEKVEICVAIDAPLLFESDLDKECDYIIALIAEEKIKIKRICARDNLLEETAKKRLEIQQKDEFYKSKADFIIENNDEDKLEENIDFILKKII